jgi:hypothetical protein
MPSSNRSATPNHQKSSHKTGTKQTAVLSDGPELHRAKAARGSSAAASSVAGRSSLRLSSKLASTITVESAAYTEVTQDVALPDDFETDEAVARFLAAQRLDPPASITAEIHLVSEGLNVVDAKCQTDLTQRQCEWINERMKEMAGANCQRCHGRLCEPPCHCTSHCLNSRDNQYELDHDAIVLLPCGHAQHQFCCDGGRVPSFGSPSFACANCRLSPSEAYRRKKSNLFTSKTPRFARIATNERRLAKKRLTWLQFLRLKRPVAIDPRDLCMLCPALLDLDDVSGEDAELEPDAIPAGAPGNPIELSDDDDEQHQQQQPAPQPKPAEAAFGDWFEFISSDSSSSSSSSDEDLYNPDLYKPVFPLNGRTV